MGWFSSNTKATERTIQDCSKMVEDFIRKTGGIPDQQRIAGGKKGLGWVMQRGSAVIYIFLIEQEKLTTLRIVSPIVYLPEDKILPFYRRCLEINVDLMTCAIGVQEDKAVLIYERPIEGLDQEELEGSLHFLSGVADDLDNKLADEFGAKIYTEKA